jgi:site-specific DNA-methyltransferase (adenine-specific)
MYEKLPLDQILQGDCLEILGQLPENSIDLIFADPPYNLQLQNDLWRPNMTRVAAVDDAWDRFDGFEAYDKFTRLWLSACRRVLKDSGALWVIGSYHNIFRVGAILQDLGFWILNDVVWIKTNPMPNFRGVRFTNAHETLIWAAKSRHARTAFNHHAMKSLNDDLQMRSDWLLPICSGPERIKVDGKKAHSTQKPEALLYRVLLAASQPGDVVLDPFFGSGTTGAVAKKLHRHWIGIELEPGYIQIASQRLAAVQPGSQEARLFAAGQPRRKPSPVRFGSLLENGLLKPGQQLFFKADRRRAAWIKPDGRLRLDGTVEGHPEGTEGSIHLLGRQLSGGSPCNGWEHWYYQAENDQLQPIDCLRQALAERMERPDE